MGKDKLKESFGFNKKVLSDFLNKNQSIPKGTFQLKKRGSSYYWYYTLSINTTDRVKYLSKAYESINNKTSSFKVALENLSSKYNNLIHFNSSIPSGKLQNKWTNHKFNMKLVNPSNKRKHKVIVVGTGLAGASASATLAELGYYVEAFSYHESPRRAHSIAAQGGINAAKNYPNDGDSIFRLFYDTIKGGDYRAREANVYR